MYSDLSTHDVVSSLLTIDVTLAKAIGATNHQVFRVIEARLNKSLNAVYVPRARAALAAAKSALPGKWPASESDVDDLKHKINSRFKGWKPDTEAALKAVITEAYKSSKQMMLDRVRVHRTHKAKRPKQNPYLAAEFTVEDRRAIDALTGRQVFWIGEQYDTNLSGRISALVDKYMLQTGLPRDEAGELLMDALEREFGLKQGPLDREGLEIPEGWQGTTPEYFDMLAANTTTNARTQGSVNELSSLGIVQYVCVNPDDEHTCDRCDYMNGKVFKVEEAQARITAEIESDDPKAVKELHPWANNVAQMKAESKDLMAAGYGYPPYHGKCRCGVDIVEDDPSTM